jgi:hypothetical protein
MYEAIDGVAARARAATTAAPAGWHEHEDGGEVETAGAERGDIKELREAQKQLAAAQRTGELGAELAAGLQRYRLARRQVKRVGRQRFERQKGQQVERYMRALRQGNPRATHSAAQRILPSAKKNSPQPLASVTASMDTVREVDPIAVVPAAWSAGRRPQLVARMAAQLHANALEATFQEGGVADPLLDPDHLRLQEAHVFAAKMHSQCDPEGGSPYLNDQISDDEIVAVLEGIKTGTATLGTSMLALKEVKTTQLGSDEPS